MASGLQPAAGMPAKNSAGKETRWIMTGDKLDRTVEDKRALVRKLDAAGWGMLFIWIGIATLLRIGWGVGFLGIGIIMLAVQLGRMRFGLRVEGVGLVMGTLFAAAGVWELVKTRLGQEPVPGGLWPILSIVAGVALVASALLRKRR
ncbi:hypothetical protein [Noviherbaspirillum suwonense]|nr:hypothetical protein [Noviherbaspirillum suwonense]